MKILVSACLLGEKVRYDGNDKNLAHSHLKALEQRGFIVRICPEVAGGLAVPRQPAEIQTANNDVIKITTITKLDVTNEFLKGAKLALSLCLKNNIKIAIMTDGSPSCGSKLIYDGSFSGRKIADHGATTRLLTKNGIRVFSQFQVDDAIKEFEKLLNK